MDLGKYSFYILTSYGLSIALILGLIITSIREQKRVRKHINDLEKKK